MGLPRVKTKSKTNQVLEQVNPSYFCKSSFCPGTSRDFTLQQISLNPFGWQLVNFVPFKGEELTPKLRIGNLQVDAVKRH